MYNARATQQTYISPTRPASRIWTTSNQANTSSKLPCLKCSKAFGPCQDEGESNDTDEEVARDELVEVCAFLLDDASARFPTRRLSLGGLMAARSI